MSNNKNKLNAAIEICDLETLTECFLTLNHSINALKSEIQKLNGASGHIEKSRAHSKAEQELSEDLLVKPTLH